jgi:hypothetical protein
LRWHLTACKTQEGKVKHNIDTAMVYNQDMVKFNFYGHKRHRPTWKKIESSKKKYSSSSFLPPVK